MEILLLEDAGDPRKLQRQYQEIREICEKHRNLRVTGYRPSPILIFDYHHILKPHAKAQIQPNPTPSDR